MGYKVNVKIGDNYTDVYNLCNNLYDIRYKGRDQAYLLYDIGIIVFFVRSFGNDIENWIAGCMDAYAIKNGEMVHRGRLFDGWNYGSIDTSFDKDIFLQISDTGEIINVRVEMSRHKLFMKICETDIEVIGDDTKLYINDVLDTLSIIYDTRGRYTYEDDKGHYYFVRYSSDSMSLIYEKRHRHDAQ